ncbi:dihydroorotase [Oceanobacillus chungangensis]|uniref:Dihydroorotase n=1 Tax=Oceanobacillus chungangensis TaxID=1229152 RepID=A0A3D8PSE1_9BACI|nr:dihydroorotase [Oceanobacillus chungangensis]RDW17905.1 dihydroorotase [Oceanobacillus chungangensis]
MKIRLKNAKRLLETSGMEPCEVLINDKKIERIDHDLSAEQVDKTIDLDGNLILPGFIDVHIHLREPGGEHKETIKTGTEAAARGGFTTVCAMPNTNPVPDNAATIRELFAKISEDAVVRVLPYAAITKGLKGKEITEINALVEMGVFAFTDDGVGIQTADFMLKAMKEAAACGASIVAHCEDNSIVYDGVVHDGKVSNRLNLPGIPSLSESVQIARDVLLAEATGCHYHVCHVSTKESVRIIRDAKRAGINVTAEVTPHHLLMNEDSIMTNDANYKMNPPLRTAADQQALLAGLLDGTIDFIATDHAPHAADEKDKGFLYAPFGIVGLETAFPLLYTYLVKQGKVTLHQLVEWLTTKPAKVFNLPYGLLEENQVADITVVNLERESIIQKENFLSKGKNTPFDSWKVVGSPILTISEGNVAYINEEDIHVQTTIGS